MSWKKNVALFLTGQGFSLFGSMLVQYAVVWYVTLETNSGAMMTMFTVASALPMFLISPFGGVWADKYNRKYLINIADGAIALASLFMALAFLFDIGSVWLLLTLAVIRGLGQGVQMPAVSALLPQIVPTDKLTKVNGFFGSMQSVAMLAAPALSGALLSFASIESIFMIDVVTAALGISVLLFFVKVPPLERQKETQIIGAQKKSAAGSYFSDLKDGIKYIAGHGFIKKMIWFSMVFNIMITPVAMLTPLQASRNFGGDFWRLTAVELAFSGGMLISGLVIGIQGGFKNKSLSVAVAVAVFGAFTVSLGLLPNFWLYLAALFVIGAGMPLFNAPMNAILQSKVEAGFMGRVFSVFTMISGVMMPLGMAAFGPLSDVISINYLMLFTGAVIFLMSILFWMIKDIREAGLPVAPSAGQDAEAGVDGESFSGK